MNHIISKEIMPMVWSEKIDFPVDRISRHFEEMKALAEHITNAILHIGPTKQLKKFINDFHLWVERVNFKLAIILNDPHVVSIESDDTLAYVEMLLEERYGWSPAYITNMTPDRVEMSLDSILDSDRSLNATH